MKLMNCGMLLAGIALVSLSGCDKLLPGSQEADASSKSERVALAGNAAGERTVAAAAAPDFGDDTSKYAKDGECDDKRFTGAGMTDTRLLDDDVSHDATDCRAAFNQGRLTLASSDQGDPSRIQWGDDSGAFANDGECDDKRFVGPGMTSTQLLDTDIQHDATDCRTAFQQGRLSLRT